MQPGETHDTSNGLKRYSLAFIFGTDDSGKVSHLLLIRKAKPQWQQGRLNGIGGGVETDESADECNAREVSEETHGRISLSPDQWRRFARLSGKEVYNQRASKTFEILLYTIKVHNTMLRAAAAATLGASEPLVLLYLNDLFTDENLKVLPNVRWMVAMARSFEMGEVAEAFDIQEVTTNDLLGDFGLARANQADEFSVFPKILVLGGKAHEMADEAWIKLGREGQRQHWADVFNRGQPMSVSDNELRQMIAKYLGYWMGPEAAIKHMGAKPLPAEVWEGHANALSNERGLILDRLRPVMKDQEMPWDALDRLINSSKDI